MSTRWSRSEINILKTVASSGSLSHEQIAGVLPGRTTAAVKKKMFVLGLLRRRRRTSVSSTTEPKSQPTTAPLEQLFDLAAGIMEYADTVRMCCGPEAAAELQRSGELMASAVLEMV